VIGCAVWIELGHLRFSGPGCPNSSAYVAALVAAAASLSASGATAAGSGPETLWRNRHGRSQGDCSFYSIHVIIPADDEPAMRCFEQVQG
jgi:hypothetical protein